MFRITRQADYGIVMLTYLAGASRHEVHTAREVARWSCVPLPMVTKILKLLARRGILVSHRGIKGGYSLALRPEDISVGEIIEALEGPIGITECAWSPGSCDLEAGCPVRFNWQRISRTVRDALVRIPLSDMVPTSSPTNPLLRLEGAAPTAAL